MKNLPHFLIVGAPKCGTTALHHYLSQHPQTNLSPKEIHFFGKDLGYKIGRPALEEYMSYFKSDRINGDASVWYLYSDSIYRELLDLQIKPKIIVMLRNPVDVCYALHSQNIIDANEDITDFRNALQLEDRRISGQNLPKNVDPPRTVFYKQTADFYPRIKKLLENVSRDKIYFGLQEDLKKDPQSFMQSIELFLGLDPYYAYNFTPINQNKTVKNPKIHQLIKKPGNLKKAVFRTLIPVKRWRERLIESLYQKNIQTTKREELPPDLRVDLTTYFKPNLILLEQLIQKKISHWWD